ncbi:MAG: alpha/beta hydrolase [Pseudomonadota bacterium]
MAFLELAPGEGLSYTARPPTAEGAPSVVLVNDLLGEAADWDAAVAPALAAAGLGVVTFDFRGQGASRAAPGRALTPGLMAADLRALLKAAFPSQRPILVGQGVGGMIAIQATLRGAPVAGLALLNALRAPGPKLDWITAATPLLLAHGGPRLLREAWSPLLSSEEGLTDLEDLGDGPFAPLPADDGRLALARGAAAEPVDWDPPFEQLDLPTLVITGLQDRMFLDREAVNRQFARLPRAEAEAWPEGGYWLAQEQPQQVTRSLIRFAASVARAAA